MPARGQRRVMRIAAPGGSGPRRLVMVAPDVRTEVIRPGSDRKGETASCRAGRGLRWNGPEPRWMPAGRYLAATMACWY